MKQHCLRFALLSALAALVAPGLWACNESVVCPPRTVLQGDTCVPVHNPEAVCPSGGMLCAGRCVLVESDNAHCGNCNQACAQNQHCADGECLACNKESRLYAACMLTGHVAVFSSETYSRVALERVGANPQALSGKGEVLLCADDGAQQLLRLDAQTLQPLGAPVDTGQTPIHISAMGALVYVVNAGSNTLQIVDTQNKPSGPWRTQGELSFGPNTSPQALAFVGSHGFVPLYGNLVTGQTSPGQRLVRVGLANPAAPSLEGEVSFSGLHLQSHPGKTALPLPYDVVHHQGALYVALNNLDSTYQPAGPGAIAKVQLEEATTSVLFLGEECSNVTSLASNGQLLVASCAGDWGMTPGRAGLALIEGDEVKEVWPAPPSFSPGSMAFKCDSLWVANANGGNVYLFSTQEKSLQLLYGEGGSEGGPMEACPQAASGFAVVQSLWLKP